MISRQKKQDRPKKLPEEINTLLFQHRPIHTYIHISNKRYELESINRSEAEEETYEIERERGERNSLNPNPLCEARDEERVEVKNERDERNEHRY